MSESTEIARNATPGDGEATVDVVLLGATGFAGGLTAEYLAKHMPTGSHLGLAGRNRKKLESVKKRLESNGLPDGAREIGLIEADSTDEASLRKLAQSTRVVITTVGPYLEYGEPLVKACAEAGTDYVDLCGEPEFVDVSFNNYNDTAEKSGARIVHACGFDSVPHDVGALFNVEKLPDDKPINLYGIVRSNGTLSGGTLHSALGQFSRGKQLKAAAKKRRSLEKKPAGRKVKAMTGKILHRDDTTGYWLVPLPTLDPYIVTGTAKGREDYGPDFSYAHYAGMKRLPMAIAAIVGFGVVMAAVQIPPLRKLMGKAIDRGDGPSKERRDRTWFTVDFVGKAGSQTARTRVSGGDPGYDETAKMLAESAMSLAFDDDNPELSGQLTPGAAMGDNLIRRLTRADMSFEEV